MKNDYFHLLLVHPELISNEKAFIKIELDPDSINKWQKDYRNELLRLGKPEKWAEIGIVFEDPYIIIIRDLVEFPDGHQGGYFRLFNQADLKGGQGVAILLEMDGRFLLLNQFRHPIRAWSFEIPRGFGEPGVKALDQARNEVKEEIGGEISEVIDLGIYHSNTGLEGNKVQLFYARLISVGKPAKSEGIESLNWVTHNELKEMIKNGQITDGFTIATYTRAILNGLIID